jgi:hypothetical protein
VAVPSSPLHSVNPSVRCIGLAGLTRRSNEPRTGRSKHQVAFAVVGGRAARRSTVLKLQPQGSEIYYFSLTKSNAYGIKLLLNKL